MGATGKDVALTRALDGIESLLIGLTGRHLRALAAGEATGARGLDGATARELLAVLSRLRPCAAGLEARRLEMLRRQVVHALLAASPVLVEAEERARVCADEPSLRRVFSARNRAAQELGWPDYFQLKLALEELSPAVVDAALVAVDERTRAAWAFCQPGPGSGDPPPWSLDEALALARAWFAGQGIALDGLEVVPVEPSHRMAYRTFLIDPPHEVAVHACAPQGARAWRWLWHELGHAGYAVHHDPSLVWSLRAAPSRCLHEAVAELCADAVDRAPLLEQICRVGPREGALLRRVRRAARLRWQREQLVRTAFERDCYLHPEGELEARHAALAGHYLGMEAGGHRWRAVVHYLDDPVSQPIYLVAEVVRAALAAALGGEPSGPLLCRTLFHRGASLPWRAPAIWHGLGVWPELQRQLRL